jgi:hypothetical protein
MKRRPIAEQALLELFDKLWVRTILFVPGLVDLSNGAMMDLVEVLLADCLG